MNRMNSLTCLIKSVFRTRSLTNQTNLFVQMNHSSQHYYFVTVLHGCQHHLISTLCELANYRPISNLPFTSIFFEKVVSAQLCSFLLKNDISEEFESGFRPAIAQKLHLLKLQMNCFLRLIAIVLVLRSTL